MTGSVKTKFLLAVAAGTLGQLHKAVNGKIPRGNVEGSYAFFNKDSGAPFYHPHMLFSAYHLKRILKDRGANNSVYEEMQIARDDPERLIFIDSGGYSIATGALSPSDWTNQMAFDMSVRNGTIYPILDIPVTPNADFNKHLRISTESAEFYQANKPGNGEIILNVAHGRNITEVKRWVDGISKVQLDGWALGSSHRGNPKEILKGMFYMLTSGVLDGSKAFHVFGVSSATMIIYFAAIKHAINRNGMKFDFDLTFDSSYPTRTFAFGNMFLFRKFDGFVNARMTNTVDWSKLRDEDFEGGFFCDCPVCSRIVSFSKLMKEGGAEMNLWGQLHNLHQMIMYKQQIEALVEMSLDVPDLITWIFPANMARNILVVQEAFDNPSKGEEIINRKFVHADEQATSSLDEFFE